MDVYEAVDIMQDDDMGRVGGIDAGDKRIGIAVSDASLSLAQPLSIIKHERWRKDIEKINALLNPYGVKRLALGDPLNDDGSLSRQSESIHAFGRALTQAGYDVIYCDERCSSAEAVEILRLTGKRTSRGNVDAAAAALILQRYLDARRASFPKPD